MIRVHYLDDDELQRDKVKLQLEGQTNQSFQVVVHESANSISDSLGEADVCLVDLHLSTENIADGIQVIKSLVSRRRHQLIVAYSNDLHSVEKALASGADDFIHKSTTDKWLALRLQAMLQYQLQAYSVPPRLEHQIVGATMADIAQRVPNIVGSAIRCVHIHGETGTGKEVVADCFAAYLPNEPFLRVNCGAIAPQLLESELFGHVKGAFTGATHDKAGYLEKASGGWIFLDELASLSEHAQAALLRVIENQELIRVGDQKPRPVSVKVLSASNIDIETLVNQEKFRNDLWQRLRETVLELPPLNQRDGEIPELIEHFCRTEDGGPYEMSPEAMTVLKSTNWQEGNIRALRNCIRAMTEKHINYQLTPMAFPSWIKKDATTHSTSGDGVLINLPEQATTFEALADYGLIELIRWHKQNEPNISQRSLATKLGLPKSTLTSRLKKVVERGIVTQKELDSLLG